MASGSHGMLARAYYRVKPFIPKSVRWLMRRSRIPVILRQSREVWPINESAGTKPLGWRGWPEGKQFALVLTHDVESKEGVGNVRNLAELEIAHGFRSSFNFIPQGPYEDPAGLRKWLVENGFEVGVHDLNHDGQLYESRESFSHKAILINQYLNNWNAVGFRSGFMLHQLEWLHDLHILYDTSTFDTDPFEPQPDGSETIFPFFVKPPQDSDKKGYVELSYTLPQDSTLFILLRESTPRIWKQKLDWIKLHGGLALVNIHPDYVNFDQFGQSSDLYSSTIISEFLEYVKESYADMFWNPLPRELAQWYYDDIVNSEGDFQKSVRTENQHQSTP